MIATVRTLTARALSGLPADLSPSPDEAHRWVTEELAKDEYQDRRSLLQRFFQWLTERFQDLLGQPGGGGVSLPSFVIAGLVVVVLVILGYFATKVRRERRIVTSHATVLGDSTLTADQLRARAATAMAEERWDDAVLDSTRAIARDADSRTLLTDVPSLTAHEIGRQLATVFPDHVGPLSRAMDLFDAVAYGDLAATRADADAVRAADELLRRARPRLPDRPRPTSGDGPASGDGPGSVDLARAGHTGQSAAEADSLWTTGAGS
ncbi:DUF4129 domain-containing protein [Lapillicoccus sp.]|uniref:DUF4129 domain-containing protein n=1 Tax=Lapillicoccus sp. TaxID=1909287 RepID=UPI0025EDD87A|nr:DUF4129 domain-containing protein [Lapillicoccus sp.]